MDLWHLIRYFFPLDESSKHYLNDTGNLGQGNYTIFADYDEVFIRTSKGDGTIYEIRIGNSPEKGPVITSWTTLKGEYKGTEIRRIKNLDKNCDPHLESLFIEDALHKFGGAIQSPEMKKEKDSEPDMRDVEILFNGESFVEEIEVTASSDMGDMWGEIKLGRSEDKATRRVIQDDLFVKRPDKKELKTSRSLSSICSNI